MTAKNAPPLDQPRIPGSAMGFLNIDCITAPTIERPPPTSIANITLGSLMFKIIVFMFCLASEILSPVKNDLNIEKSSLTETSTVPSDIEIRNAAIRKMTESVILIRSFCFILI